MIILRNITKVYDTPNYNIIALSNINLSFSKGEIIVILGRSGSGKSTLLNIIGGFDQTYSGRYIFNTSEIKEMEPKQIDELRSKSIGFIFQNQILFNHLTVLENVKLALDVLGITNEAGKKLNVLKALTLVGLKRHAYKYPWQLSGGEKQRLAIARAIVKNPEIIICDEPTAALDRETSKEILDLLATVSKDKILIIATHNKSIVRNYGTRLIELRSGYMVKNELIKEDKSNVDVDEFDELIDKHLYDETYVASNKIKNIQMKKEDETSKILKDLQIDYTQFKKHQEDVFYINKDEYKDVIESRKNKFTSDEKLKRFGRTSLKMTNQKDFVKTSVKYYKNIYLLFTFILFFFIFILVTGMNLTNQVFMKHNNEENIKISEIDHKEILMFNGLNTITKMYPSTLDEFVEYTNLYQGDNSNYYNMILGDANFKFRYTYDIYEYLKSYLTPKDYAMYYTPYSYLVTKRDENVYFDNLQTIYELKNIESQKDRGKESRYVTNIMGHPTSFPLGYLFAENNKEILSPYLLKDSRLPRTKNEVALPIDLLVQFKILKSKTSNVNKLYDEFSKMKDEKKIITLNQIEVTINEDGTTSEKVIPQEFKIVGLLNTGSELNGYYYKEDLSQTMIFSHQASDLLNLKFNNRSQSEVYLIPLYMEISRRVYESKDFNEVLNNYRQDYLQKEYELINQQLAVLKQPLETAFKEIRDEYAKDPSIIHNTAFLSRAVDQKLYPHLSYKEILEVYTALLFETLDEDTKINYCKNCVSYDFDLILSNSNKLLNNIETYSLLNQYFKEGLTKEKGLNVEKTMSYEIYSYYNERFNPNYDKIEYFSRLSENDYFRFYMYLFFYNQSNKSVYRDYHYTSIFNMEKYEKVMFLLSGLPTSINKDITVYILKHGYTNTNKQALTYSGIFFIIITMYLLTLFLANLFGNLYRIFFVKRKREIEGLRLLGASVKDIKQIIRLELRRSFHIAFGLVVGILLIYNLMIHPFVNKNMLIFHLIEQNSRTYYTLYLFNFIKFNILILVEVYLLMRYLFMPALFNRTIMKNLREFKTLESNPLEGGETND